ncbi:hypothetical protein I312_103264 [Cryptococcus bacillisporus CA1280]|uniref:NUDE domain-containing protein n=1 Tax=Cryptococcus bacillisporus CA1280 TaxID=1296109 RepID=A0A0D0UGN0_CRYGA|nr:hypothetical protein I312_03185 [Cryptococcus bacillisporus CA1280]
MSAGHPVLGLPPTMPSASVHAMPSSSATVDDEDDITFDSSEDEIAHYREKHRQALEMLTDTRAELEEFQQSSKELEDEMEQELAANDKQQADLRERIKRLDAEKEEWRTKHIALQKMHSSTTSAMQREMDNLRSERDKTLIALRDLEMGNDELERNERVAVSSLLNLESKYNRAIEEKTLLEQDLAQKDELEAETQRLKDELREANEEISILKDQLARAAATPPSSVSTSSPIHEATCDLSRIHLSDDINAPLLPPPIPNKNEPITPEGQSPRCGLSRSGTMSSIPVASPSTKRFSQHIPHSPSVSTLSRSTTSRNLAAAAGTPGSPALSRSRSGIPQASPARGTVLASHQQTKSRGFKLLHDLQARLKATDDKLGVAKVPRRNVSNPASVFGVGRRVSSAISTASSNTAVPAPHARVTALVKDHNTTPTAQSQPFPGSGVMSPGWVLVGEGEGEDTPTGPWSMTLPIEPDSPLDPTFRSSSTTSNRSMPSRPGIPSPLASGSARSIASSMAQRQAGQRPSSRLGLRVSRHESEARPLSPSMIPVPLSSSRPMSPDAYQPLRSATPTSAFSSFSVSASTSNPPRPSSRTGKRNPIGRGPPPLSSSTRLHHQRSRQSLSGAVSTPTTGADKVERAKRGPRRSSFSNMDKPRLTPASAGSRIPSGRPTSVHVFRETPPPVPRIPNAILKESRLKK